MQLSGLALKRVDEITDEHLTSLEERLSNNILKFEASAMCERGLRFHDRASSHCSRCSMDQS